MTSLSSLKKFNDIYDKTYSDILKYVIIKCHDINDAKDIIQETYLDFWKILNKKELDELNIRNYLIGIAINKIKRHYRLIYKIKTISIFDKDKNDNEIANTLKYDINIEDLTIKNDEWDLIWNYIKHKKDQNIPKIFYLHYKMDLTIKEIATSLGLSESYVKNAIYRTLKELFSLFGKESN